MSRTKVCLAGIVAGLLIAGSGPAAADELHLEVGGFAGYHLFSANNELGAEDAPGEDTVADSVAFGLRAGYFLVPRLALEAEVAVLPTETEDAGVSVLAFAGRLSAVVHLFDVDRNTRPFALAGIGAMAGTSDNEAIHDADIDFVTHAGIGVKQHLGKGWGLRADARVLFPPSTASEFVTTDFEVLIGFYKAFDQPPPPPPPPPPVDSDGDGLLDPDDKCPTDPEDFDKFEDTDGCPDVDNDGDGVFDVSDKCPLDPEDKDSFEDDDGCPDGDNDADGIPDTTDKCPLEPEDKDSFEDDDGCPDADNDHDGIVDSDDACPLEPETKNGFEDTDGCPDVLPAQVKKFTGTIPGITFKSASAEIRASSYAVLDEAVAVLNQYPDLKLEIQGHTDDVGTDAFNQQLSEQRAASVKAYFVAKGVDEARLTSKGFGESQPEIAGTTKAARAKNRRVVFVLVQ